MEQPWEEQLSCKDGPFGTNLARQIMWNLLQLEGVTLDGIAEEIAWYQGSFILFLISALPPVSGRKIVVQKHPMVLGFFVFKKPPPNFIQKLKLWQWWLQDREGLQHVRVDVSLWTES